jgi:MFS family permease
MITNTVMSSAGGYIAVSMGYTPILYASLTGDILGTILLSLFLRETLTSKPELEKPKSFSDKFKDFFMPEPGIRNLYLMFLIMGFGYGTSYSLLYGTLVDHFGVSDIQLGLMSTTFNLTLGLASIPIGKLSDRVGRRPMFLASLSMSFVTVVGYILARSFEVFLLLQITNAMDMVFWIPAWISLIAEKVPQSRRSTVMGKIDAYMKISGIPAPWIGGIIYSRAHRF